MALLPSIEDQIAVSKNQLMVKISSPRKIIYQGIAISVSSVNSEGPFDILADHGNFVTLVQNHPVIIRTIDKKTLTFIFPLAVIYTRRNRVTIFTDIQLETLTN
jgi:F0F1-type ATP synthase epsilon subunit